VEDQQRARDLIEERGESWTNSEPDVSEQLQILFVNPFYGKTTFNTSEPDATPIGKEQCRSAILFGPPGTSKTTLARAVAGQLGWRFVELHSSHFVAEGLSNVQKVADQIFDSLMQVDHAVVLFDEVDELVRVRAEGTDQFGRFLTTSMLPRLAELWKRGKIIYFVNTNYIQYFDSAITRSERFDALIFVPPPSFEAKKKALLSAVQRLTGAAPTFEVNREEVDKCFDAARKRYSKSCEPATLTETEMLAKFKLVRFDQIQEVAEKLLGGEKRCSVINSHLLSKALQEMHDAELLKLENYANFSEAEVYARRDFGRMPVYEVVLPEPLVGDKTIKEENGRLWKEGSFEMIQRSYSVSRLDRMGRLELKEKRTS
jgi:SpoVK/Ycf46/Vps4 family AAA+-type ATPase